MNWISVGEWVRQRFSNWYILEKTKKENQTYAYGTARHCQPLALLYYTVDDKTKLIRNYCTAYYYSFVCALEACAVCTLIGRNEKKEQKKKTKNLYIFELRRSVRVVSHFAYNRQRFCCCCLSFILAAFWQQMTASCE